MEGTSATLEPISAFLDARLMIVDDDPLDVQLLCETLEGAGYHNIVSTFDPVETVGLCRNYSPDLILLDSLMPKMDGSEVMVSLKKDWEDGKDTPIMILTGDVSFQSKWRVLAGGASDLLHKPYDAVELLLRVGKLLKDRRLRLDLLRRNRILEIDLRSRTELLEVALETIKRKDHKLEDAQSDTLDRLASAGEFHDNDTGHHTRRVGELSYMLGERLGIEPSHLRCLRRAARLHDIGKIGISDVILLKPGKLTHDEFEIMKTHTTIGANLFRNGQSELFRLAQCVAESHHERWDGHGYPEGLKGEQIPLEARIVALADVFDALTHDRPYKSAWSFVDSMAEIKRQSGCQFDPRVVESFIQIDEALIAGYMAGELWRKVVSVANSAA